MSDTLTERIDHAISLAPAPCVGEIDYATLLTDARAEIDRLRATYNVMSREESVMHALKLDAADIKTAHYRNIPDTAFDAEHLRYLVRVLTDRLTRQWR